MITWENSGGAAKTGEASRKTFARELRLFLFVGKTACFSCFSVFSSTYTDSESLTFAVILRFRWEEEKRLSDYGILFFFTYAVLLCILSYINRINSTERG